MAHRFCIAWACAAAATTASACAGGSAVDDAWSAPDRAAVPGLEGRGAAAAERERAEPSALYRRADGTWWRTQFPTGTASVLLLSRENASGVEQPRAAVVWATGDPVAQLHLGSGCTRLDADELERLYVLLLGLPAELPLRVLGLRGAALNGPGPSPQSAAAVLRRLGLARAALDTAHTDARDGWWIADVEPQLDGNQPLAVAVQVSGPGGKPLAGVSVSFKREPHLACWAVTEANGRADCQLQDEHDHKHPDNSGEALPGTVVKLAAAAVDGRRYAPQHVVFSTPAPTRCLSAVVAPELAARWPGDCRGFAARTWSWSAPGPRR